MEIKELKKILEYYNDDDKIIITNLKDFYNLVELNSDDKGFCTLIIK